MAKIAKVKRNNQKRNKLIKQGTIKKKSRKSIKQNGKQSVPKIVKQNEPESEESDGEDMLQMVEDEDIDFIKSAIANRSYSIFNKIRYTKPEAPKPRKRKLEEDETLEETYETEKENEDQVKYKNLLPIKTKKGVIPQKVVDNSDNLTEEEEEEYNNKDGDEENKGNEEKSKDDGEYIFEDSNEPKNVAQLIAMRLKILREQKIKIGTLSSQVLENPEDKVTNLRTLLNMIDECVPEVKLAVGKLVIVSLMEIFKEILPTYMMKNIISEDVKLKKETLRLHKYEENLLLYYKMYLQKLEKYCSTLRKKKGDSRKTTEEEKELGVLALRCMCDMLESRPYFNYSKNIAQTVVPFLNHSKSNIRDIVKNTVKNVFKEDKRQEVTLHVLRAINHYLKNHSHNVNTDMLEVLLVLNLHDVNLDQEKEDDIKQKKLKAKKHKILQMSKKERKRKKKLALLEKEMLETKGEESKQVRQHNLTEITKIVFNIYFRILKNSSNTKVLGVCLEGLAKFAHCINLEFYMDLVSVLDKLMKEDWIGYREQLHCIKTVFTVLSGIGEALNLDPTRFYNALYKDLLTTHASKNHSDFLIVLRTLDDGLIKRRKKITNKRMIGFVKRLSTLSLQLLHNGSLGCLGLIKTIIQLNKCVDILLDLDNSVGDGRFLVDVDDPEYANASQSALFEMIMLTKHYNPVVSKYAKHIAFGVPGNGEGSLPLQYAKCTPEQLYVDFSMDEMAFNPPIPAPKKVQPKSKIKRVEFEDHDFENECKSIVRNQLKVGRFL